MIITNKRDYSIDLLKFIAALLITWSHFEKPLGEFSILATGGAFGDSLFFFASGYTLLLSKRNYSFINWYKRRINRIYPTVFTWALFSAVLWNRSDNMIDIIIHGGGFFVTCIMVFYLLFYPIKLLFSDYMWIAMFLCFITLGLAYFVIDFSNAQFVYYWKWSFFFISMLLGAAIGKRKKGGFTSNIKNKWMFSLLGLLVSVICYYTLMSLESNYQFVAIFTIIPLIGFTVFLFELCNTSLAMKLYETKTSHLIIMTIGGLCLEIYIVQPLLLTDKMNHLFPFNLLIMFMIIILVAYILKSASRLWSQTFKDEDYNWKEIIKLY